MDLCAASQTVLIRVFLSSARRLVGGMKKNDKKSENRRPETPASLPWSLKTTRLGHQIETNSIWRQM